MELSNAPRPRTIFITGTTGFVGSHFLLSRPRRGEIRHLLVRAQSPAEGRRRIEARLEVARAAYVVPRREDVLAASHVVVGDLAEPRCGVSTGDVARIGRVDDFWHFAASLDYRESMSATIEASNLSGTAHAIELAKSLGAQRFLYVSTAYTVGARAGDVREDLHPEDSAFNNEYERTKCAAEHEVARLCEAAGLEYRILRLGVVVGTSCSFDAAGSTTGLYGFAAVIEHLKDRLRAGTASIVIDADPETPIHLIPVDRTIEDLAALERAGFGDRTIYHVTGAGSVSAREVVDAVCRHVGVPRVPFRDEQTPSRNAVQRLFERNAEFFFGYMKNPKRFVRSLADEACVSADDLERFVEAFVAGVRAESGALTARRSA